MEFLSTHISKSTLFDVDRLNYSNNPYIESAEEIVLWIPHFSQINDLKADVIALNLWSKLYNILNRRLIIRYADFLLNDELRISDQCEDAVMKWVPALSLARGLDVGCVAAILWVKLTCVLECLGHIEISTATDVAKLYFSNFMLHHLAKQLKYAQQ